VRLRDRNVRRLVGAPFAPRHWRALRRMPTTYERPAEALRRYVSNGGSYPWTPRIRTPLGVVTPELTSYHDLLTVNEVFCRRDYGDAEDARLVVDIGANVGLAALFFLTRNPECRVHCFEPDPANLERLRTILSPYADRVVVVPRAVTAEPSTTVRFLPAGRYGRISPRGVEVPSIGLEEALARVPGTIDLVKIDTEGTEGALVAALLSGSHVPRVRNVVYEDATGRTRWVAP
jgi:FkbM family methyltransferase